MSESTKLWHPFANMAAIKDDLFVVDRAEGVWIFDAAGNRYLDGTASLWSCNVGHGREEIIDAAASQMRQLDSFHVFNDFTNEPAERLAQRLSDLAPMEDAKVILNSGGGDSIDTAVKLARRYWVSRGEPDRTYVLSRRHSYHGTHGFGTSIAGIQANREGYGDLFSDTTQVSHDDPEDLRAAITRIGAEKIAAFFAEPVIGAGGVRPPQPGYLEAVAKICADHGILFVADSVISAFGRIGSWFGVERWQLKPDMIIFAKAVTSGYLPLGGVLVAENVARVFWDGDGERFTHGQTYSAHPTVAAAALANIDIIERENLLTRADELEQVLHDTLLALQDHPGVAEVRGGTGVLGAVELTAEVLAEHKNVVTDVSRATRALGVLVRPLGTSLAVSPPLTVTDEEVALIGSALGQALTETLS